MELNKIKQNLEIIRKIEKSSELLFENLEDSKKNNFSLMNMITFIMIGFTASSYLTSGVGLIPMILAFISAGVWGYASNTPANETGDNFEKFVGKKFKKIANSKKILKIYKSNLTDKEIDILNEIYSKEIKDNNILLNLIFSSVNKEYIEENNEEFFELIDMIEFKNKEEEKLFKSNLINTMKLNLSNIDNSYEELKKQAIKNKLNNQIVINKTEKEQKMILKSI